MIALVLIIGWLYSMALVPSLVWRWIVARAARQDHQQLEQFE